MEERAFEVERNISPAVTALRGGTLISYVHALFNRDFEPRDRSFDDKIKQQINYVGYL